jgi:hypothetical protein
MWVRQGSLRAGSLILVGVLLAASGVTGCGSSREATVTAPSTTPTVTASRATGPSGSVAGSDGCPRPPRNLDSQTVEAVSLTIDRLTDGSGFNYALSDDALKKHPELLVTGTPPKWSIDAAWADGLVLLGGAFIQGSFRNPGPDPITVTNVRLVNITEECMPLGLAYLLGNEGGPAGDVVDLRFDIDADTPTAYEDGNGNPTAIPPTVPYFGTRVVTLAPNESQYFTVRVGSLRRPYSFDVAFDVTVGGRKGVQLLRNGTTPFRFAPKLCPSAAQRAQMKPDDITWMKNQLFKNVRVRVSMMEMGEKDPSKYSGPCNAL